MSPSVIGHWVKTPHQRPQSQPRCTQRPWKHRLPAAALETWESERQADRRQTHVARAGGKAAVLPAARPAGRPPEGSGRGSGARARRRGQRRRELPNRRTPRCGPDAGPRRGPEGHTGRHSPGKRRGLGRLPGGGGRLSPAARAGRGRGRRGRRRGTPLAPPPGQRPWPRARCWFRVVRQPRRRRGCEGPGGGGGAAWPCPLSRPEPLHLPQA